MIISKTPFRIPLSGGGTDIKFYYELRKGELLSLAINQYAYVFLTERKISKDFLIQTTKSQFTKKINHIDHDLIRETLKFFKISIDLSIETLFLMVLSELLLALSKLHLKTKLKLFSLECLINLVATCLTNFSLSNKHGPEISNSFSLSFFILILPKVTFLDIFMS